MLIARLAFLISILGFVVGLQNPESTSSSTTIRTMRAGRYCQRSGGYCRMHGDCCSRMCIQVSAECR
ncbi:uncharacterized protein LOC27208637 [Drosophila simulans]|uniref:uncharacterized protein LOC27208637 n=1 Tax=Drosophila simulans TaxID=7240 RepID=UPI00078ADE6A|nr:uncharacterized protein LOC27208637 [Drosophila simulans]KMZ04961.1 uncharacterized protein Dsimw501_GD28793 [Drosophila simulans]